MKGLNTILITFYTNSRNPFQVWFQNRRAKYRKKENTKKGPGRPAHNAHPQSCSGEPMSSEELERKERERREKKLMKQLEKQQKKLQAKGIHVDVETLRKDYEAQRAGGKSTFNMEAALAAAQEEIDVVGGVDESFDDTDNEQTQLKHNFADIKKKISPFSIESLLAKRQLSVAMMANAASAASHEDQENNNPPMVSPIPTSCSSPHSRASMTSPPPSARYLSSPSPSPKTSAASSASGPPPLHFPIPIFANANSASASSPASNFSHELSLLKPLTASPEKPFSASFLSKISLSSTLASLQPEPPLRSSSPVSMPGSPPSTNNLTTNSLGDQSLATVEAPPASTLSASSPSATSS